MTTEDTPLQRSARATRTNRAIQFATETKFHVGLLVLARSPMLTDIPPVVYLKAAGEGLFLTLLLSWIVTFIFQPQMITENPLKTRLGYDNLCVGWDLPPANYVASILWIPISYLALRFVYLNDVRFRLQESKENNTGQDGFFKFAQFSNYLFGIAVAVFTLVLVIPPFTSAWLHSLPFIGFIVTRFLVVLALCLEDWPEEGDGLATKIFLYVYGFISIVLPLIYIGEYTYYDIYGVKSPWYWQITCALDYGWFACLAVTSKFIPSDIYVHRSFELVGLSETDKEEGPMDQS